MGKSDNTEYIARISYGKDSMKMLDVIRTRGLLLDRITTTDVWATDTIPAWLPPLQAFRERMDQWIWDRYRIEVEHLCARNKDGTKRTYEQMFYHVPKRRSQSGQVERERERERERRAPARIDPRFPRSLESVVPETQVQSADTRASQLRYPHGAGSSKSTRSKHRFSDEPATTGKDRNIVEYIGIAADEPKRHGQLNVRKRAPLVEFGIDEDLCGLYCQYAGCLSPTYETSCRDGCWFCHNQGVVQLRLLRRNYPDLWALLLKWDLDSPVTFKADGHTVLDFDFRFRLEDEGRVPRDRSFRWNMLLEPAAFPLLDYEQISLF